MNSNQAIMTSLNGAHFMMTHYLSDLDDKDLLVRPVPGANHIAWQLGHLVCSEHGITNGAKAGSAAALDADFIERYSRKNTGSDDPNIFRESKKTLLEMYSAQRDATLALVETLSESDFDAPSPEKFKGYGPTVGSLLLLQGSHEMLHAGQVAVIRRVLGKPILI